MAPITLNPIDPYDDPRVTHETATLNGLNYHYFLGVPKSGRWRGTIFLIHGWPDLAMGWRFQVPALIRAGFRVVVPDMCGYGSTDAPDQLERYSFKGAADDMAELARQLGASRIVLGGHDWGGLVVYRMAEHYPSLVTHVIGVCTPYVPAAQEYRPLEEIVKSAPQLGYQLQLSRGELERAVDSKEKISQLLSGAFGGMTDRGEPIFDMFKGFRTDLLGKFGPPRLMDEKMLKYYTEQYARNGVRASANWYRTTKINFDNDKSIPSPSPLAKIPVLYIQAAGDLIFSDRMIESMKSALPRMEHVSIEAMHWVLVQKPREVNEAIVRWIHRVVIPDLERLAARHKL